MKNKVYFVPFGDEKTASSRLRVYNIGRHIENAYVGKPEKYEEGDVLILQKVPDLQEIKRAHAQGAKVIFDIDDYYWDRTEYKAAIDKSDLLTVDTEEKQKHIGGVVIPDSLDWDGTKKETYGDGKIVGWTGYGKDVAYLKDIAINGTLRVITSPDFLKYVDEIPQSRPWSLQKVDKYLSECDYGMYRLPDGMFEQVKGMHKLLKNWAIGLPTYTSPMPDYVKAMREVGLGDKYIVTDWAKHEFVTYNDDIERCREYALRYSSENIAKLWEKAIKTLSLG